MFGINFTWGNGHKEPVRVERDKLGNWFYTMFSSRGAINDLVNDRDKLITVLRNPACLKVLALNADIFSLGNINKYDKEGKEVEKNFLYSLRKKPNFKQTWTKFMWDYSFWVDLGTAYLWNPGNSNSLERNPIQWLIPYNINWTPSTIDKLKALIFSETTFKEVMKGTVSYDLGNGDVKLIPLSEITPFFNMSNGLTNENPYKGSSRINALYKVVANSESGLDAKGINLDMVQKFLVSGQQDPNNTTQLPMSSDEKNDIEDKVGGFKRIHAVKSKVTIERFVENMAQLKLDESFQRDMITIGSIYNMPKGILDIVDKSLTFDNQEKEMGRYIEYVQAPKAQMLTDHLENQYELEDVRMSWGHLSFNQAFEKERAEKVKIQLENIEKAKTLGLSEKEATEMMKKVML